MRGLDTLTHGHTHMTTIYSNPRCACAPRVNESTKVQNPRRNSNCNTYILTYVRILRMRVCSRRLQYTRTRHKCTKMADSLTYTCSRYWKVTVMRTTVPRTTDRLGDLGDSQLETTLLRSCLSLPKLSFTLRSCPPSHICYGAKAFDEAIRECLEHIIGGPISQWSWLKASLPSSRGGLNLRSAALHAPAAFLGSSPECGLFADMIGDHQVGCGGNGDRISRHNNIKDVLFSAAQSAALGPRKEAPGIIPNSSARPAPNWSRGRQAALDVSVISPLQQLTLSEAAVTPGHALQVCVRRKLTVNLPACRAAGVGFVPVVVEVLGGWSPEASSTIRRIGDALGKDARREEWCSHPHLPHSCRHSLHRVQGRRETKQHPRRTEGMIITPS